MAKILFLLLLTTACPGARAVWVEVSRNEEATIYVDFATLLKSGSKVKMWDLFNFHAQHRDAGDLKYLSEKSQLEYDCQEEQQRTLFFSYHAGKMGGGYIVYSDADSDKWEPVLAGSMSEVLWKAACGKK